jgi:hypothetical protein
MNLLIDEWEMRTDRVENKENQFNCNDIPSNKAITKPPVV